MLLDERLYKRAKSAAAKAADRYYGGRRSATGGGWRRVRGDAGGGPLYNRHCVPLLDQFMKTQMLSHFLSEGTWE